MVVIKELAAAGRPGRLGRPGGADGAITGQPAAQSARRRVRSLEPFGEANEIAGSQLGSQRRRYWATPGHSQPPYAQLNGTSGPHLAPSGDHPYVPSKQRDARTLRARFGCKPIGLPVLRSIAVWGGPLSPSWWLAWPA
jgi:hypothetical protein